MALTDKLTAIANAIRIKTGNTGALTLDQMASEVEGISTGVPINNQDKTITKNGTYTADEGFTGLGTVSVNVARDDQADIEKLFIDVVEGDATDVTLPSGLTKIRDYAFYYDKNVRLTSLPDSVTSIGEYAFCNSTNIALTSLPDGITSIGQRAFYGTAISITSFPESLKTIEDNAFSFCDNLQTIFLHSGLTKIGNSFSTCGNLTDVTFGGKPSSIGEYAFSSCYNLLTINVPWAEGEVAKAPWGAPIATINYNYVSTEE